jgi:hypothetical protein
VLGLLVVLGGVGLAGVGLGGRAVVRGQKARVCEAGTGDDVPEACRAACASEPKTFCVKHGDLARAGLDAASLDEAAESYEKACDAGDFYRAGMTKGRFLVSGAYDAARGSITLAPGKWVDAPPGWLPVGMTGQVSAQKTVFAGKMDAPQCGPFYVVRQVSDMFDTKCGAGSRFVEGHGCVPTPREGATVLGTWAGTGTESTGRTWAITVTLDNLESGRCGRVAFPSQNCAGDWYCTMSSDGKQIRAREVITSGQGTCDSTGVVEFTVSDDGQSADYKWTSPRRSDVSSAHLARAAK